MNKEYLTKICVSESTYRKTKEDFVFRELDTIKVKGKTKGVKIYELIGFASDIIDMEKYRTYEQALVLYYAGQYKKARDLFSANRNDLASAIMTKRCDDAISGVITVLDGVYTMIHK